MANTSRRRLMRKLVGRSSRFPLLGTWISFRHSGHAMILWRQLVRRIPFKHCRQKTCKHGSVFGSVNVFIHTEQETSWWRLSSKVLMSMARFGDREKLRQREKLKAKPPQATSSGRILKLFIKSESDYLFSPLAAPHFLVNKSREFGVRSGPPTSTW